MKFKVQILSVMFTLIYPVILKAAEPENFPICTWTAEQSYPAVSGSYVVWQDKRSGNYDIYRNNPENANDVNGVLVVQQNRDQTFPSISGNTVVWQDTRISTTNINIYRYTLPSGPESEVCTNETKQETPVISGSKAAWVDSRNGNRDIFYRNIEGTEAAVCAYTLTQDAVAIDGNIIVWRDLRNGDADIYGKNLGTNEDIIIRIADSWQQSPAVSGNVIVWHDDRNGDKDIYGKNLLTGDEIEICKYNGEQINPAISGDVVVWEDQRSGIGDIYAYRISTQEIFPICTNAFDQKNPAISGNLVVWEDYRNGSADIYGAYIPEPVEPSFISVSDPNGGEMLVAGGKHRIKWKSDGASSATVKLEYSSDSGASYSVIDANAANNGEYLWQPLPSFDSTQCLVRISDSTGASDISNDVFTIYECDDSLTGDLNSDCKVDYLDFAEFTNQWLACGNPHDANCLIQP